MKFVLAFSLVGILIQVASCRPLKDEEGTSNVYISGNIRNSAMSYNYSKSQAASDRNNSEWNNTQMNKYSRRNKPKQQAGQQKEQAALSVRGGRDAVNIAIAYGGSEAQAAENNQNSRYSTQIMGFTSGLDKNEHQKEQNE